MKRDIRETDLYREAHGIHVSLRRPGTGQISDAAEVHASPDGRHAVFSGTFVDKLEGTPPTRICQVDLTSGDVRVLTFGLNTDRLPKYSPDGRHIAFLSDRLEAGDFQLFFLDPLSGAVRAPPPVEGWVEYYHWSPDGRRILLAVAGRGADIAGGQGAVTSKQAAKDAPSWMPTVTSGDEAFRWRRAWVYDLDSDRAVRVGPPNCTIWDAAWCGNEAYTAVVSPGPDEGLWYNARLVLGDIETGHTRDLYTPEHQLGGPAASPSGNLVAIVEAICSDRGLVAGNLHLIDATSGSVKRVDTGGVDIAYVEWRTERQLLLAGHRGFETVVAVYDSSPDKLTESWASQELTTTGFYVTVSGLNDAGDCVLVGEGFERAPEIAVIEGGAYRSVRSFDLGYADHSRAIGAVERLSWSAPDGLEIQGWLLLPTQVGPHPLVMNVHGGPVWQWRPRWLGRRDVPALMLLRRGYAVFLPNPRGSTGRGQAFVRHVLGDLGGADAQDLLAGLASLVERRVADPKRLGIMGQSYGGFMSAWLITQDTRFAAAVPIAPHTNQVTEHLLSNIPTFVAIFLKDQYNNPGGRYFERSPIMHAHKAKTPTLNICGALDRCTPPEEAMQFHNALLENGVESVLVTYPEEGHGIRRFPAAIDYAARVVGWFEEHMPATAAEAD